MKNWEEIQLKILDFIETSEMKNMNESEKAKLLCYFAFKENKQEVFTMPLIIELFAQCGYNLPNSSRLKDKVTRGTDKSFLCVKRSKSELTFIPAVLQHLDKEYGVLWDNTEHIESSSEVIDEVKFTGKRKFLDKLIEQINNTYLNHCYDASAVLLRRLLEVLLVLSYQKLGIDDEIKDSSGNGYIMLDGIVKNAKNNTILKLSRIKTELDVFRKVGNFSAHNITYTAGKKDIDDIKLNYRVMLEELYVKAGLM